MTTPPDIPESHRPFIGLLRSAVNRTPLSSAFLRQANWDTLLLQARQHGVDNYLYPWLAEQVPSLYSPRASVAQGSAPAAWRTFYFQEVQRSFLRQKQLSTVLDAFAHANIDVVPLKGAMLCETLYDDPARRSMSDLDLLVRNADCDRAHSLLLHLGYENKVDARNNAFACDQVYRHAGYPAFIELHWGFHSDACPEDPRPDVAQIWEHTICTHIAGAPVLALSACDQLAHLVEHLLHHHFAVRLRAYIDIALLLQNAAREPSCGALQEASARWDIGDSMPFVARFVTALLGSPCDQAWWTHDSPSERDQRQQLAEILLRLPLSDTMVGESSFLQLADASKRARLRYALSRIFMPRDYLALRYAPARSRLGLPLAWALRAWDLFAMNRDRAKKMAARGQSAQSDLRDAAIRRALVRQWKETKKPE